MKLILSLIILSIYMINFNNSTRVINQGELFNNVKDYYVDENLNYYSGGKYTEEYCKDAKYITVPLGTAGGLDEGNLSSFILTKKGSNVFIALDAGTVWQGVRRLVTLGNFNSVFNISYPEWASMPEQRATWFIRNHIAAYFIGHSHLDHVGGLIVESAEDYLTPATTIETRNTMNKKDEKNGILGLYYQMGLTDSEAELKTAFAFKKPIIGLKETIDSITDDLFNNKVWPNLPSFGRYNYYPLSSGIQYNISSFSTNITDENISKIKNEFPYSHNVKIFSVCHDSVVSGAFLFTDPTSGDQIAFFSDTGITAGMYEGCDWEGKIAAVWRQIKIDKLRAVYLESSFVNAVTESSLYGHLRPKDIMKLMDLLLVNSIQTSPPMKNLKHVKLIIEHIKPIVVIAPNQFTAQRLIYQQLVEANTCGIKVVIPNQGVPICI